MADEIIAPGTYFTETMKQFNQEGVPTIMGAFIGPTTKGKAFIPTPITTNPQYITKFGSANMESYIPYAVEHYVKWGSTALVTRILGLDGYKHEHVGTLVMSSSYGEKAIGIIHHTSCSYEGDLSVSTLDGDNNYHTASTFNVVLSGSNLIVEQFSSSLNPTASNYIGKMLGKTPKTTNRGYFYTFFNEYVETAYDSNATVKLIVDKEIDFDSTEYSAAETPWITSQLLNSSAINLFKVKHQTHGVYTNREIKIAITNIRRASEVPGSDYGTFSLVVRDLTDKDKNPVILESWSNLNLDPDSPNYICRVIGDKVETYDTTSGRILKVGDYENNSEYIVIEVSDNVKSKSINPELIPYGFAAVVQPAYTNSIVFPTASMVTAQELNGYYNEKVYFGFNFDFSVTDNQNYLVPIPAKAVAGDNTLFNLDKYFVHNSASVSPGVSLSSSLAPITNRKFIVPFQGGFDGMDPAVPKNMGDSITTTNSMGYDFSTGAAGERAYIRALNILSNAYKYNIHLLFTPGIIEKYHSYIVASAIDMCENRKNTFYAFDPSGLEEKSPTSVVAEVDTLETNYAGCWWSWQKIFDSVNNKYIWVPGSVAQASVFAYNDKVGYEWYAPAGYNRGILNFVTEANVELDQNDIGILYSGRINPIGTFGNDIVVWGQKTLQTTSNALDRVNVRRLLINLKYFTNSITKYLNFEQNTEKLRAQFVNKMNPYMESVQSRSGLYVFKIVMDESINTGEVIDRYELRGQVKIQPTKAAEYILIDFQVYPTGADFDA